MKKAGIGIVGCGSISGVYLRNLSEMFPMTRVVACSDAILKRAEERAAEYKVPKACSVEELLEDEEVEIVLNITIPVAHAEVSLSALNAGKNVFSEKPLATTREDGKKILDLARKKKVRVGCAPDTFLGAGIQTCRKLIDDGWIGEPIGGTAFMLCHGREDWHPDPDFFYKAGGGPMFDMGPYYLTALVTLLGPVERVAGSARITFPKRPIFSEPRRGQLIEVEVPTHVASVLDFKNGAMVTLVTSFDVWDSNVPLLEIYGSEGTMNVPDPNIFGGHVSVRRKGEEQWREFPMTHEYSENSRGLGLAEMASSLLMAKEHRANAGLAYHVLDVMQSIHEASKEGRSLTLQSTCERPVPFPIGYLLGDSFED